MKLLISFILFSSASFASVPKTDSTLAKINSVSIVSRADNKVELRILVGDHEKKVMELKINSACDVYKLICEQTQSGEKLLTIQLSATGNRDDLDLFVRDLKN